LLFGEYRPFAIIARFSKLVSRLDVDVVRRA
jgi:hypothetical protein